MKYVELSMNNPQEDLAVDEVLLDLCENGAFGSALRLWIPRSYFVVLGYGNRVASEVNVALCQQDNIPILRRCSGGGTVLQGPGCMNFSLILPIGAGVATTSVSDTNGNVMKAHRVILEELLGERVEVKGHTDLVVRNRKFSGNSQRRRGKAVLFHGSFLLRMDLQLVERYLRLPSRMPQYRSARRHSDFLTNIDIEFAQLCEALKGAWHAQETLDVDIESAARELAACRYFNDSWNFRR